MEMHIRTDLIYDHRLKLKLELSPPASLFTHNSKLGTLDCSYETFNSLLCNILISNMQKYGQFVNH